ncbi:MAG TPA: hypothetical protein VIH61_01495, partial [Waddliaceae bacterium]
MSVSKINSQNNIPYLNPAIQGEITGEEHGLLYPILRKIFISLGLDSSLTTLELKKIKCLSRIYHYSFLNDSIGATVAGSDGSLNERYLASKIERHLLSSLLLKIENHLYHLQDQTTAFTARSYITHLLHNPDRDFILAELGTLYFYLNRDHVLPCPANFLDYRQREIEGVIQMLKGSACSKLPSGITAYLLRAFCEMVVDTTGKLSHGGILATLHLLTNRFSIYFKDEHCTHIGTLLKRVISDRAFATCLETPLPLDPAMEIFIRIDLKLPINQQITWQHVQIACLIALLYDLRQVHRPNCYSVATLIYGVKLSPLSVLKKYREMLNNGFLNPAPGVNIPICALVLSRLVFPRHLNILMSREQILISPIVRAALLVMGSNFILSNLDGNRAYSLKDIIYLASEQIPDSENACFIASYVVGSFTKNALQQMLVSSMEFLEINHSTLTDLEIREGQTRPRGVKNRLIQFINEMVFEQINTIYPDHATKTGVQEFLEELKNETTKNFWLQDYSGLIKDENGELQIYVSKEGVSLPGYSGDYSKLESAILVHRRLLCIFDNQMTVINTSTTLTHTLRRMVDAIYAGRISLGLPAPDVEFIVLLKAFFLSSILPEA